MFNDFEPAPRTLSKSRDELTQRTSAVDAARAEMVHHACIVAEFATIGNVPADVLNQYETARDDWSAALVELNDARPVAIIRNSLALIESMTGKPAFRVIQGGAS